MLKLLVRQIIAVSFALLGGTANIIQDFHHQPRFKRVTHFVKELSTQPETLYGCCNLRSTF